MLVARLWKKVGRMAYNKIRYSFIYQYRNYVPFDGVKENLPRFEEINRNPAASQRYAIFFTARSGSSRLSEILHRAGLSEPDESFNPDWMSEMAGFFGATNMPDYINALTRMRNSDGVWGFEITYLQLLLSFRRERDFLDLVNPTDWIWLIRKDIVAQAVSISRMIQTNVYHNQGQSAQILAEAEAKFTYNAWVIRRNLIRIVLQELLVERMFKRRKLEPLRLSYEQLAGMKPEAIASGIARFLGRTVSQTQPIASSHSKIGTAKNDAFAEKFRKHHRVLMLVVGMCRSNLLQRLPDQPFG